MRSTTKLDQSSDLDDRSSPTSGIRRPSKYPREVILMWCIGTACAAAMLTLLVSMCLAEISIQRNMSSNTTVSPATAAPVTLAASR
jgi:hypothetical protein